MERQRLLVVEDEEAIRTPLAEALAGEGFAVEVADSGAQALEAAERTDPDLVLLDLMLPVPCRSTRFSTTHTSAGSRRRTSTAGSSA
jgi:DNA-binding response OmpR family regulator